MQSYEKQILIYLISRVFLPGLFSIFWPAVFLLNTSVKKNYILYWHFDLKSHFHIFLRHFSLTCPNHKHIFVEYIRPRSPWCLVCQDRLQVHIWKIKKKLYFLSSLFPFHSGPENLKKSRQKNSRNQINQNFFFVKLHFRQFQTFSQFKN